MIAGRIRARWPGIRGTSLQRVKESQSTHRDDLGSDSDRSARVRETTSSAGDMSDGVVKYMTIVAGCVMVLRQVRNRKHHNYRW